MDAIERRVIAHDEHDAKVLAERDALRRTVKTLRARNHALAWAAVVASVVPVLWVGAAIVQAVAR